MSNEAITEYSQKKVNDIITRLEYGEQIIPTFQRDFEWENIRIVNFMNSMICDEPFGYIVSWKTKKDKALEESKNSIIKKYSHPQRQQGCEYLIDGQQRLTTCFIIKKWHLIAKDINDLGKRGKKSLEYREMNKICKKFKDIHFNLETRLYENVRNNHKKLHHIGLDLISKYYFLDSQDSSGKVDKMEQEIKKDFIDAWDPAYSSEDEFHREIRFAVTSFKRIFIKDIGHINLQYYDLDKVIEIFQNMNTKGKPLSVFDLLHSKWYEKKINLSLKYDNLILELQNGWKSISKDTFIDVIYLLISKNERPIISNKDKLEFQLDSIGSGYEEHIDSAISCILKACEFLEEYNFSLSNLPSEIIIRWISYFFSKKWNPIYAARNKSFIIYYISIISINGRYSSSTTTKLEGDIKRMDLLINNKLDELTNDVEKESNKISLDNIKDQTYKSTSMFSKFLIWWLTNNSSDPFDNKAICKVNFDNVHLHHVFPKNMKDKKPFDKSDYDRDSILNIWPIKKSSNSRFSNKNPSVYIAEFPDVYRFEEILREIGIKIDCLRTDNFHEMMKNREEWIKKNISSYLKEQREKWTEN